MDTQTQPTPSTLPEGLRCPKCGESRFKTVWQTFANGTRHVRADCAKCKTFVRYLKQDGAPEPEYRPRQPGASAYAYKAPPSDFWWIGYIRPDDGLWYAIALARTPGQCWDVLRYCPMDGETFIAPCRPPVRGPARPVQRDLLGGDDSE
jgi:hypothetical protein